MHRDNLREIADELRRLRAISPTGKADLKFWYATTVPAFNAWMHERFPDVRLPKVVMFYLHDADVRVRDAGYRTTQEEAIDALIDGLEKGRLLEADTHSGCALPLGKLGAGALLVLVALWWLLSR
ncbi:hypothetical protein [Pseudoxanthomonas sp. PXM01]|uniref:hypothetical protein n=1 Tax=Pseudoxanthomonas sp. PXM01 TaxID=2769295 RepID=UPI00177CD143|nr:hypothetical protein [Pseudoxanthomonas sp. PXM01]MBD9467620.1 hypothetical protein [Pseudoxanthomonas sp. PXM01]